MNTNYYANIRYIPTSKWYFETKADITNYNAQNFDDAISVPLLTARIGYSFLKAEKAEISLYGFDLLNQYAGFRQFSVNNNLTRVDWNTLSRYVMLSFRLNFR